MRAYKNKNFGGGLLYEFINCCEALVIAVKNKDEKNMIYNVMDTVEEIYQQILLREQKSK